MSRSAAGRHDIVYSIGHSTRSAEQLIGLLVEHRVAALADIRTVPRSRRHPHFDPVPLAAALAQVGIAHAHIAALGGLRKPRADSRNTAWRNASFRGYADHMETAAFAQGGSALLGLPAPVAVMCAEAVPWRCHRWLLADALLVRCIEVVHILGPGQVRRHELTAFARRDGGQVSYPGLC
jgi:uncharacterized protein (DUF488 family)